MSGDNFDALTNKELHTKCLEYGLPDIPVTNSSRSVILKRLRVAFYGTPKVDTKVKKTTTRRETVHVSTPTLTNKTKLNNISEHATDLSNNNPVSTAKNRYTTDYSYNFSITPTQHTDTSFNVNNQTTNEKSYERIVPTIATNTQTLNAIDNTYISPVISEGVKPHDASHLRRSASLTKSPVLTTSYNQEVPQRKRIETSDIGEDEYEEEEEEEEDDVKIIDAPSNKYGFNRVTQNYSCNSPEAKPQTEFKMPKPIQTNLYGFERGYGTQKQDFSYAASNANKITTEPKYTNLSPASTYKNVLNSTPYEYLSDSKLSSTSSPKIQYGFTTALNSPQLGHLNNSPKENTLYPNLPQSLYLSNSTANPDYISNTYQANAPIRKRGRNTLNSQHKYDTNSEDDGGHSSDDYPEAFNNYQRRTEHLTSSFNKSLSRADRSTLHYESPKTRRPINTDDDDEPIRQFFQTLERKYHLKQSLALIMCFVLAAFIYAFFLH